MTPLYIVCHNCLISSKGQNYCSSFRVWGLAYLPCICYLPKTLWNVFSHVCLSVCPRGEGPPDPNPSGRGTSLCRPSPSSGPPAGDIWCQQWEPVQTCSAQDLHNIDIWWLLKHVWLASGRYASYWNTFLFVNLFR